MNLIKLSLILWRRIWDSGWESFPNFWTFFLIDKLYSNEENMCIFPYEYEFMDDKHIRRILRSHALIISVFGYYSSHSIRAYTFLITKLIYCFVGILIYIFIYTDDIYRALRYSLNSSLKSAYIFPMIIAFTVAAGWRHCSHFEMTQKIYTTFVFGTCI